MVYGRHPYLSHLLYLLLSETPEGHVTWNWTTRRSWFSFRLMYRAPPKSELHHMPSDNVQDFRRVLRGAKHILIHSGAGLSAASGVPTFRGNGGMWRKYDAVSLATPHAFAENQSRVWQFYHYRRELSVSFYLSSSHLKILSGCSRRSQTPPTTSSLAWPCRKFATTSLRIPNLLMSPKTWTGFKNERWKK